MGANRRGISAPMLILLVTFLIVAVLLLSGMIGAAHSAPEILTPYGPPGQGMVLWSVL
jgi:hypothetical protein